MTVYALYVAKLVTSHEVRSTVNPVPKKIELLNFPGSQIQAQQAFTLIRKVRSTVDFTAKIATIKH
jgi:hypothetical protein